jgi:hypothetical protein
MLWVTAFDFCEMLMNHCTYIIDIYYKVLQNVFYGRTFESFEINKTELSSPSYFYLYFAASSS